MGAIKTYTGLTVDPCYLNPTDIDLVDIAHSLSRQCRYMGHCVEFYSIAQHSVKVCRRLQSNGEHVWVQAAGLLHDASEAYLLDVPRPLKVSEAFQRYHFFEDKAMRTIFEKYSLPYPLPHAVEKADMAEYEHEETFVRTLQESFPYVGFWTPEFAKAEFFGESERLGLM